MPVTSADYANAVGKTADYASLIRPTRSAQADGLSSVIASAAKQSIYPRVEKWIASLRSQ